MTSMMEGMTVTFLPERPAIQLTKECSPGVSKNVTCKGNMVCCNRNILFFEYNFKYSYFYLNNACVMLSDDDNFKM